MMSLIIFWISTGYVKGVNRPVYSPIPSKFVASDLGISRLELLETFTDWITVDKPPDFYHRIEDKKYTRIFYNPHVFYLDGSISLSRPWGNHWRGLGSYSYQFTVEPVIHEASL